ncbi:MAG: LLM class flavin-dependent oxidoreductase [Streptosporangiales bacterium]|nr:LLM class flavin-dependent oxidoreductase [Streptosporangiales bacterium]
MHRSLVFAASHFEALVPVAQQAAASGFHRIWTTESTGRDATVRAVALASAAPTLHVGTGIAYAFTRPPLAAAAMAADAYRATGGRFTFGIGAGTRGLRRRYAVSWEHPAPQFAEYARLLRQAVSPDGGRSFDGRFYTADLSDFLPVEDRERLRGLEIYGSGVNQIMLHHCAASCDGVAVHSLATAPGYFEDVVVPALRKGAEVAGAPPKVACWVVAGVAADREEARLGVRRQLAFYFSTPSYRTVAEHAGWGSAAERIRQKAAEVDYRDWDPVADLVTDEMVDTLSISGTPAEITEQLARSEERLGRHGVDELALQMVGVADTADRVTEMGNALVRHCAPGAIGTPRGVTTRPEPR